MEEVMSPPKTEVHDLSQGRQKRQRRDHNTYRNCGEVRNINSRYTAADRQTDRQKTDTQEHSFCLCFCFSLCVALLLSFCCSIHAYMTDIINCYYRLPLQHDGISFSDSLSLLFIYYSLYFIVFMSLVVHKLSPSLIAILSSPAGVEPAPSAVRRTVSQWKKQVHATQQQSTAEVANAAGDIQLRQHCCC